MVLDSDINLWLKPIGQRFSNRVLVWDEFKVIVFSNTTSIFYADNSLFVVVVCLRAQLVPCRLKILIGNPTFLYGNLVEASNCTLCFSSYP